jgi:hypothetical protein
MQISSSAWRFQQLVWPLTTVFDAVAMHPVRELKRRSLQSTADYIEANMPDAIGFGARRAYLRHVAGLVGDLEGVVCEFGVFKGESLRLFARELGPERRLHGFDSFEGLPEEWTGHDATAGTFDVRGRLPDVPATVSLHPGWFDDSLPRWKKLHDDRVALLHIDCDLYSSTRTVLDEMHERLQPGSLILFDEYFNYPGWQRHEYRAFQEHVADRGLEYRYVAFSRTQVAVRVDSL